MIWMSCVDKVDLELPPTELPLIIEGQITDQHVPYLVKISRAFPADGNFYQRVGIAGATVSITDDLGNEHALVDSLHGNYFTDSATMQGVIGRTYVLRVELNALASYESTPQKMMPSGSIDSIHYKLVEGTNNAGVSEYGLNIYVDAQASAGSSLRMRWVFNGTYQVNTDPSLVGVTDPDTGVFTPLACSAGCECCYCFVSEREEYPIVIDNRFLGSTELTGVFMKYIPINNYTFNQKYKVQITQMEVSQDVYDFYKGIKGQIENANSLFQPPFFELKGNVRSTNSDELVIGVFSAVATVKKSTYILRSDLGIGMIYSVIPGDCRAVAPNSSITPPPDWE